LFRCWYNTLFFSEVACLPVLAATYLRCFSPDFWRQTEVVSVNNPPSCAYLTSIY
jgi:hypothetical protein